MERNGFLEEVYNRVESSTKEEFDKIVGEKFKDALNALVSSGVISISEAKEFAGTKKIAYTYQGVKSMKQSSKCSCTSN
jgi:hypothetical protein